MKFIKWVIKLRFSIIDLLTYGMFIALLQHDMFAIAMFTMIIGIGTSVFLEGRYGHLLKRNY
jgi:hypothetical protein